MSEPSGTQVRRLPDALKVKAKLIPDRPAHDDTRRALTFADWDRQADEVAGGLAAEGLKAGERVFLAISMDHAIEMAIAAIATMRAGGVACPVNTRSAKAEFLEYSRLVEPRFAITDIPGELEDLGLERIWTVDAMPRNISALPDQTRFDAEADAVIVGTSGTTGRPKGVVLSHPSLLGGRDPARFSRHFNPALHSMPFTGYGEFTGQCLRPILDGQTSLILYPFDAGRLLKLIEAKRPVSLMLVPTMLRLMLDHVGVEATDMSSVRVIVTGTAPVPHDSIQRARRLWPNVLIRNTYGMAEGGVGTATTTGEQLAKPGCVGKIAENMEIRDELGNRVQPGVIGEIYGKSQGYKRRYWRDDGASRSAWVDGWTKSGDLGYVDEDGDLILTGRSKELIIRGGYNIAPIEIEDVLHAHPAVQDAAVVGVSHDVLGEDVAAAVSLKRGSEVTAAELVAWCQGRLAANKAPRTIVILDALPLNQNAKIVKRELQPILEEAAQAQRALRHAANAPSAEPRSLR